MNSGHKKKGQKYKNTRAFNPTLHDTSRKTKQIMETQIQGVCSRCKDVIEWKIRYKKYKPLTQPGKCVKCLERNIMQSYYVICSNCSTTHGYCAKCGKKFENMDKPLLTKSQQQSEDAAFERELNELSERKRRALLRHMTKKTEKPDDDDDTNTSNTEEHHTNYDDDSD